MSFWKSVDWLLFLLILVIVLFGIAILVSIGSFSLPLYPLYLLFAFCCFFLFSRIDFEIYKNFDMVFYILGLVLLVITFTFGTITRGAARWLDVGLFSIQASELVKPLFILSLSSFALKFDIKKIKDSLLLLLFFIPVFFFVLKQPDLGNAFIYLLILVSIFYSTGGRILFLAFSLIVVGLLSPLVWNLLRSYQQERILSFINPSSDPLGIGYNLIQAVVTVGSGRLLGRGLGVGTQSTLRFLPERSTDFIFASTAEEIGFLGCFILLTAIFFLLLKILIIGFKSKDGFAKNVVFAGFTVIFAQTIINVGMNLGMLPITGVTLPLVSHGGSSLVATMIILGIINNISFANKKGL